MPDPTSFIPERLKEKLADSLVELLAGSAERLGEDQIADKIRRFSSRGDLFRSVARALEAGSRRFIEEYTSQDEDLVEAIGEDELFWQSEIVQDALVKLVSRPGAWLREEREAVAYHFETILPKRVNRERVDKAINFLLRCIAEELWSMPGAQEIRAAYSIQFQELSVEAQREQVELARQQLQATTQMSADLRQALLQLVGLVEQKMLAAPAPVAMLASPRPYHNLPQPTYTQFVGRDEELDWLRQRLSPADRAWQIAITGIGGVGKSALALAIAWEYQRRYNELPPEDRFEAIIWVSAKEEVLTAFGRERANVPEQVLHTLEDVYTAIARVLEREDITRAQSEEQNALVEKALKRQRTLLIMDNLESVKDDRIKAFLRNLPSPTKAIITSRESLDVADVRPLTGLRREEAEALIEEDRRVREVSLTPQQRKRIFDLTSGLPLPIKLGIGRMAGGESFAAVERWLGDATGELPEYCVKGQIGLVRERDPNAWTVLLTCALFDREAGASREALGKIADLSLADRDKALAHLQRLFLLNRTYSDRFWVLPIVQRYASVALTDNEASKSTVDRWLVFLAELSQTYGKDMEWNADHVALIGREYSNLVTAVRVSQEQGHWPLLFAISEGAWNYAYLIGLFNEMDDILLAAQTAAMQMNDEERQGIVMLYRGRLLGVKGRYAEALPCLEAAEHAAVKHGRKRDLGMAWATRSAALFNTGHPDEAGLVTGRLMRLAEEMGDLYLLTLAADRMSRYEAEKGRFAEAAHWVARGKLWATELGSERRLAAILHREASNLIMDGKFADAEEVLHEALRLASRQNERRYMSIDKRQLARVYLQTGRIGLARQMAEEALQLFESLGMTGMAEVTRTMLNTIR